MKIDKNHPCFSSSVFGDYLNHTFEYRSREHRICIVCDKEEILFNANCSNELEDWRPVYKKIKNSK